MPKAVVYGGNEDKIKKLAVALKAFGFDCLVPSSYSEAVAMFEMDDVIVFVINETDESRKLIQTIKNFPMYRRRNIFLGLVGENLATMDRLLAFKTGVNLTINSKDIENFSYYFKKAYIEYQNFYKSFKEILT